MYGKHILIQKIGEGIDDKTGDTVMRIHVFDKIFDELPTVKDALETLQHFAYPNG